MYVCAVFQRHLVDAKVGVGRDNSPARKVNPLARQVSSETTLLTLQPLHQTTQLLRRLRGDGVISSEVVVDDRQG